MQRVITRGLAILFMATAPLVLSPSANAFSNTGFFVGGGASYAFYLNSYSSLWTGKSWVREIDTQLDSGIGEYLEMGNRNRKLSMGLSMLHTTADTGEYNIWFDTSINSALVFFEYIFNEDECINFYINGGMGVGYLITEGIYKHEPVIDSEAIQLITGSFSDLNSVVFAYNLRLGVYLSANSPLLLRMGYQYFGTTSSTNSRNIGVAERIVELRNSSVYGTSTAYMEPEYTAMSISEIKYGLSVFELGVVFFIPA